MTMTKLFSLFGNLRPFFFRKCCSSFLEIPPSLVLQGFFNCWNIAWVLIHAVSASIEIILNQSNRKGNIQRSANQQGEKRHSW